ncbi:hypothetical protein [Lautropia mirabilis]|jgi:hypothetical protein
MKNWNVFLGVVVYFVGMRVSEYVDVEYMDYVFVVILFLLFVLPFARFHESAFPSPEFLPALFVVLLVFASFCLCIFLVLPMKTAGGDGLRDWKGRITP